MNEEFLQDEYDEYGDKIEYYAIRPNKTQIKKDIGVLFKLGEEMSTLSVVHLKSLALPEKIYNAVIEVSKMQPSGARKRLLKFIAGQLHKIDAEPIFEKLARIKNISAHTVREHHIVERWRDRLLKDGNNALTELLDDAPHADRQLIRHLVRNAQKEATQSAAPKSARQLYQYLKALFTSTEEHDEAEFDDELEDDYSEDADE